MLFAILPLLLAFTEAAPQAPHTTPLAAVGDGAGYNSTSNVEVGGPVQSISQCNYYPEWTTIGFDQRHCDSARYAFDEYVKGQSRTVNFELRAKGKQKIQPLSLELPRRWVHGTCTFALAMLSDIPQSALLPDRPRGPYWNYVLSNWDFVQGVTDGLYGDCVRPPKVTRMPMLGYRSFGFDIQQGDNSLEVVAMYFATASLIDSQVPYDPALTVNANTTTFTLGPKNGTEQAFDTS